MCLQRIKSTREAIFNLTCYFFQKEKIPKNNFSLFHKIKTFLNSIQEDGKAVFFVLKKIKKIKTSRKKKLNNTVWFAVSFFWEERKDQQFQEQANFHLFFIVFFFPKKRKNEVDQFFC